MVEIVNIEQPISSRRAELKAILDGVAFGVTGKCYLCPLAEAMRLGGAAYHGRVIMDAIGTAEDVMNELFFAELDDLAKMKDDGRSEHTN